MGITTVQPYKEVESFTIVHNYLFDEVMPNVKPNAWKVLCLIVRKTYGWQKDSDHISFTQIKEGTGMSSPQTITNAIKQLAGDGHIIIHKSGGKWEAHEYSLNRDYTATKIATDENDPTTKIVTDPTTKIVTDPTTKIVNTKEKEIKGNKISPSGENGSFSTQSNGDYSQDDIDRFRIFGIHPSEQKPNDDLWNTQQEIADSGWEITIPTVAQAIAYYLMAVRKHNPGFAVPNNVSVRRDWHADVKGHLQDYLIKDLEYLYSATVDNLKGRGMSYTRPGSLTRTLPLIENLRNDSVKPGKVIVDSDGGMYL